MPQQLVQRLCPPHHLFVQQGMSLGCNTAFLNKTAGYATHHSRANSIRGLQSEPDYTV
jgi:hypothetical protein